MFFAAEVCYLIIRQPQAQIPDSAIATQNVGRSERKVCEGDSQKPAEEHRKSHAEHGTVKPQEPAPSTITLHVKLGTEPEKEENTLSGKGNLW